MDAGTPNPNKPRLSRRLLSHFTLTLSVLLALSFVTLAVVGPTTQDAEAIVPLVAFGIGVAVTALASYILYKLAENNDDALLNGDTAAVYAANLANGLKDEISLANDATLNFAEHQDLLMYYYIRCADWAARDLWIKQNNSGSAFTFNQTYVLEKSKIFDKFTEYITSQQTLYNSIFAPYEEVARNFAGAYSGLRYYAEYGSGMTLLNQLKDLNITNLNRISIEGLAYYDGVSDLYGLDRGEQNILNIYKMVNNAPVSVYYKVLNPGDGSPLYKIPASTLNLPAGIYKFSTDIYGNMAPVNITVGSTGPATISPGLVLDMETAEGAQSISGAIFGPGYVGKYLYYLSNGNPKAVDAYLSANVNKIGIWPSSDTSSMTYGFYTDPIISNQIALLSKFKSIQTIALQFAQSYYNAIVVSGDPGGAWDLPLMLIPDYTQMEGMDWQQIYALYIAYLQSAHEWYQDHQDTLDASIVTISGESLKLKVRGSIVNQNGVTLYDNTTIWTPFVTLDEITLAIGSSYKVGGSMYGLKWGNANELVNFTSSKSTKLINIDANYTLYIKEIMYDGEYVDSVTLTPTTLDIIWGELSPPIGPPKVLTDAEWLLDRWYYFAMVAGTICLLAAISLRNTAVILVGVVLLAAGGIGYYLAGDFSLLDAFGLSLEPTNLRVWLQQLR